MSSISTLRQLAQAATPVEDWLDALFADQWTPRTEEYLRACSPDVILRLLACVEAADAWREAYGSDIAAEEAKIKHYDRARAALDAGTKP